MSDYPPPPPSRPGQPPQQPQVVYVQQKKNNHGCLKAFGIAAAAIVVLIIIIAVAAGQATKDDNKKAKATCSAFTYPDKQASDHCADANGEVQAIGWTVTAKNIRRQDGKLFGPEICADVTMHNRADAASSFNTFDFKLQTPSGVVKDFELTDDANLHSGQVVPGGNVAGAVCFNDVAESGQFILIWKGDPLAADRGIWFQNL